MAPWAAAMPDALSFNLDFNAGSDPIDTTVPRQAHANTFRRLLRLWEKRTHFSLILAVVDHTDYRDALIRQLDAQRQGSHVMLGAEDAASEWLRQAQDACASGSQPLQVCLPLDAPRSDGWWQQVNLLRERLADAAPLPQIVWLSNTDVDQAAHHAPDLWNWREAVLELNIGLRRTTAMGEEAGRLAEYPADREAPPSPERLRQIEAFLARQTTDSESDTILTAGLRLEAATEYLQQGHPGRSQVEATRAAQLFHEYGDVLRAAHALQIKAKALVLQGQLAQAIEVMTTQVIPVVETTNDQRLLVSTLTSLAEMLVFRGQAGDAEQALRYFQRSLQVREDLLRANPDSAQAARDLAIALERLAGMASQGDGPADRERGLAQETPQKETTPFYPRRRSKCAPSRSIAGWWRSRGRAISSCDRWRWGCTWARCTRISSAGRARCRSCSGIWWRCWWTGSSAAARSIRRWPGCWGS